MFAEVAVNNRRIQNTFHYHIPPELTGDIAPGHLVKIAFGTAQTTGIVVGLHRTAPVPETKPILARLDPEPVVTPAQIALAGWLAQQTLTALGACLWLMLPPGLAKRGDTRYTLIDDEAEAKSRVQAVILSLLRRRGPLRGRQLDHALPQTRWHTSISSLVKRGVVQQEPVLDAPDVRPKTVRTARLAIPPERVPAIAPYLGRESRRANVLEVLLATQDGRLGLSALIMAAGCSSDSPIRTLDEAGDVRLHSKTTWIELAQSPEQIEASIAAGNFRPGHVQRAVLDQLMAADGPLTSSDVDTPAAARLESAGLVRRWHEAAWVELLLSPDDAAARIIDLRGGAPYLALLILLAEHAEDMPVQTIFEHSGTTLHHLQRLADDGLVVLGETELVRDPLADQSFPPTLAPPLTPHQARVWEAIRQYMDTIHWGDISPSPDESGVFLLHGVTGSGKTEIYLRAVERVLAQGRQAIVMVPEIALTPQTIRRFAGRFPHRVAVIHSRLTVGERYDTWRRVRAGEIQVVVGARSALFAPLPDVGLIILDEEHDDSYKQTPPIPPPYYHAREAAIALARITRGTVILGSATPDVVTAFRAQQGHYTLLELPERLLGQRERLAEQARQLNAPDARYAPASADDTTFAALPAVHIVDMRQELRQGNRSVFSRMLQTGLNEVLAHNEQAIVFLNRRGTATFVMCRDCGHIAACPRCSSPLTYHGPRHALMCHHCGHKQPRLTTCPACGSQRIKHFGQGTELIENAVRETFPQARALRLDRDAVTGGGTHDAILDRFAQSQADILIGTQMIAKGLDLPNVTLVGIMSADTALGLPDYRAGERTFQLLTQVAGRAGRSQRGGRVILQSYQPDHYAIQAAAHHDYATFYEQELVYRQTGLFPPYRRLARIVFQDPNAAAAETQAHRAATIITQRIADGQFSTSEIIGPTPCFFARLRDLYRWQLVLRSTDPAAVLSTIDIADNWVVDIDPVDML